MSNQNTKDKNELQEKLYEIQIVPIPGYQPPDYHKAKFREEGNFVTCLYTERKVSGNVKRVDATHYKTPAGEIREYSANTPEERNRVRRTALRRTFRELCALIRTNFCDCGKSGLFVTLTYRENMTDRKRLYKDFELFMKRLRYAHPEHDFEYITVMEPQGRGAWHVHLMLKSTNSDTLLIPDAETRALWRNGITSTQRLKSDDVGRYYVAYFTGVIDETSLSEAESEFLEYSDTSEDIFIEEQKVLESGQLPKKYVKGARLHMYPKHFKFYRCSSGIVRPEYFEEYFCNMNDLPLSLEFSQSYEIRKEFNRDIYDGTSLVHKKGDVITMNRVVRNNYGVGDAYAELTAPPWKDNIVIKAKELIIYEQLAM